MTCFATPHPIAAPAMSAAGFGPIARLLVLQAFLIVSFFMYYQTRGIPGTLHAWLLLLGLTLTAPALLRNFAATGTLPFDYVLMGGWVTLILLTSLVNVTVVTGDNIVAYLLTAICYVVVRHNAPFLSDEFLYTLLKWFLACNGTLVLVQFVTGEFYPARYFAAGDPPLIIPSGVSDGATKNGLLISFAACFMFAKVVWSPRRIRFPELLVFVVGVFSLVLSTSRAGLLSFAVVVALVLVYALLMRRRFRVNAFNSIWLGVVLFTPILFLIVGALTLQMFVALRDPTAEAYAANVLMYKLTHSDDESVTQRYEALGSVLDSMSPLSLLSVGSGIGSYVAMNEGFAIHNSYVEIVYELGIYGFAIFVVLLVHVVRKALRRQDAVRILPVIAALLSGLLFTAFHDVIRGRTIWIPLAIAASFAYSRPVRQTKRASSRALRNAT